MSCCGVWCRKPRYKRLVDSLFPENPQDDRPVATNVDKLVYFAQSSPEDLDKMGKYLTVRLRKSLHREKIGLVVRLQGVSKLHTTQYENAYFVVKILYIEPQSIVWPPVHADNQPAKHNNQNSICHTCVALQITEKLLAECELRHLQLIADSYLNMLHLMLESSHNKMRIMATNSFVAFADREEGNTPYHRQYDSFIHHFASLSLSANRGDQDIYRETRLAGLCGLRGVIKKIGHQDLLQLNIWDIDHMNKIVPPFLFNMQDSVNSSELEMNLVKYAENGLKELVVCAGLAHIDSVILPVLQHFDLNHLWTQQKDFSTGVFVTIVKTMQKQDRYKAIQALVQHLDDKSKESCDIKQGILDTLSQCVIVAADGSLGPSVLDVFRTLVKHLRISIEGPLAAQAELQVSSEDSQKFQKSITKTVGEFAGVLPDYHKPDIMSLINSYMVITGPSDNSVSPVGNQSTSFESAADRRYQLSSSLVQCLKAVADTYHPAILDPTFPDTLFTSLVQLFTIKNSRIQLDAMNLWHQLIDHHHNREKIPLNVEWSSLEVQGFVLSKASPLFLKKTVPTLNAHLFKLAENLSLQLENLEAFYCLLFLLTLELGSDAGVLEMVLCLNMLQKLAVQKDVVLPVFHRNALHAIVGGILYLISKISSATGLQEHITKILALRKASAVNLLPDGLFASEDKSDGAGAEHLTVRSSSVDKTLLFNLDGNELLRRSPDPRKGFGRVSRESSSSGPDLTSHFSVSLDYGGESPLSADQISFNSLKDRVSSGEEKLKIRSAEQPIGFSGSVSFQEAVGKASDMEQGGTGFNLADILSVATSPTSCAAAVKSEQHRNSSAFDMELPSLH